MVFHFHIAYIAVKCNYACSLVLRAIVGGLVCLFHDYELSPGYDGIHNILEPVLDRLSPEWNRRH
jgi:hypothetical protein